MADQQRKVSLIFEANASQAKNEINGLVQSLQKIQSMPRSLIDPTGIREASKAAMELQGHIQKAVNVDTGKLDLSRFATSLASSGKSLDHYRDTLTRIGPEGSAAFRSVLSSINNAEVSTVRLTKGMRDFLTTMKNTAKWQISSSIMHGLIGGLQSAWGYAQSLDRSLNDIRIVTGQTSEQMARFAAEANKAAQVLSTTTTKYTDAALIFYQQGLGDNAVKERTEAVIKMANVTGEAAKDVSSYMTAIWNNFDKGTKPLEYYGDVITKLGAATAASSEEIAGGLEKFAAIANTIGLSYEYATSMITTIVDKTRQSEDVVGTALKTILARIQGLNLGETLEDGTTLNKYSEALATVGVHIKDASGQIKNMDVILDDLGAKWGTLGKDTQIALAQVVGGVRQYNQVLSLMDNWGSFEKNVGMAQMSSGTLNKQADIYAESWEGARDRVRAAAEGIYDALINEDVFIKLDDIFTHLLNGIGGVVKGMGGMIPMLSTIGGIITTKFAKEMPVVFNNLKQNLMVLNGKAENKALETQQKVTSEAELGVARASTTQESAQYETIRRVSMMRENLIKNMHQMNSEEIKNYELLIQNEQAIGGIVEERAKALDLITQETQQLKEQVALRTTESELSKEESSLWNDNLDEKDLPSAEWQNSLKESEARFNDKLRKDQQEIRNLEDREENNELNIEESRRLRDARRRIQLSRDRGSQEYVDEIYSGARKIHQQKVKDASTGIVTAASQLKQAQISSAEFKNFLNQDFDSPTKKLEQLAQKAKELQQSLDLSGGSSQELNDAITKLGNTADTEEDKIKALNAAIDNIVAKRQAELEGAKGAAKEVGVSDTDVKNLEEQGQRAGAQEGGALDRGDIPDIPERDPTKIQKVTEAVGSLMAVYGAFNAILSAHTTLMDKNATAMEKTGAIVGALMSVMMAVNTLAQLATTLKIKEAGSHIANAAATSLEAGSYGFLTTMVLKAKAAIGSFMASNPVGWILAIVAAVIALGIAISKIDFRSAEQKYLDNLKEKSEGLKAAQDELRQSIEDVESAFSAYETAVDALKECTVGTQEWRDALTGVSDAVNAILSKSPELAKYARWDENGQFYWDQGYYDAIEEQKSKLDFIGAAQAIAELEYTTAVESTENPYGQDKLKALREYEISKEISDLEFLGDTGEFARSIDYVAKILEIFGLDQGLQYLREIGITPNEDYIKNLENVDNMTTEELARSIVIDDKFINSAQNNGSNLKTAGAFYRTDEEVVAAQTKARTSVNGMFAGHLNYNADRALIYGNLYEEALDEEIAKLSEGGEKAISVDSYAERYGAITGKTYTRNSKGEYLDASGKVVEGLTDAGVLSAIAASNIYNDTYVDDTIRQGNAIYNRATDFGKSVLTAGGLSNAKVGVGYELATGPEESFKGLEIQAQQISDYKEAIQDAETNLETLKANAIDYSVDNFKFDSTSLLETPPANFLTPEVIEQLDLPDTSALRDRKDAADTRVKDLEGALEAAEADEIELSSQVEKAIIERERLIGVNEDLLISLDEQNDKLSEAGNNITLYQGEYDAKEKEYMSVTAELDSALQDSRNAQAALENFDPETYTNATIEMLDKEIADAEAIKMGLEEQRRRAQEVGYKEDEFVNLILDNAGPYSDPATIVGDLINTLSGLGAGATLGDAGYGQLYPGFEDFTVHDVRTRFTDSLYTNEEVQAIDEDIAEVDAQLDSLYEQREQEVVGALDALTEQKINADQRVTDLSKREESLRTRMDELTGLIASETKKESSAAQTIEVIKGDIAANNEVIDSLTDVIENTVIPDTSGLRTQLRVGYQRQDALASQIEEAEDEEQRIMQEAADQTIYNEMVSTLLREGVELPQEVIEARINGDYTLLDGLNTLQGYLEDSIDAGTAELEQAESELGTAVEELNKFYEEAVTNYLLAYGFGVEEFKAQFGLENASWEDIYNKLGDTSSAESQGVRAYDIRNNGRYSSYFQGEGIDLTDAEVIAKQDEFTSRQIVMDSLTNGTASAGAYDASSNESWKEFLKIYGDVLFGENWEDTDIEELLGTEALKTLQNSIEQTKKDAAAAWNLAFGAEDFEDNGIKATYNEETEQINTESATLNSLSAIHATGEQISEVAKLMASAEDQMTTEAFSEFDKQISSMITNSKDASLVTGILNTSLEKISTTGKLLTVEDVATILDEAGTSADKLGIDIEDLTASINDAADMASLASTAFERLSGNLANIIEVLNGLQKGDTISSEDWEKVKNLIPKEYLDLFLENAQGGKTFTGTNEQGKQLYESAVGLQADSYIMASQAVREIMASPEFSRAPFADKYLGENASFEQTQDWVKLMSSGTGFEQSRLLPLIEAAGYGDEYREAGGVEGLFDSETGDWSTLGTDIVNLIHSIFTGEFTDPDKASEVLATSGLSDSQIYQYNQQGVISNKDAEYAYGINLDKEIETVGLDLDEVERLAELLGEMPEYADKSTLELKQLAKAQLRWNRSVESGNDNLDDWKKKLKTVTDKGLGDFADAIDDVDAAYSDLLDIDLEQLSEDFLTDPKKMEQYEDAIRGDTAALEEFKKAAADDLYFGENGIGEAITQITGKNADGSDFELTIGVDESMWDSALADIYTDLDDLNNQKIEPDVALENINAKLGQLKFSTAEAAAAANASLSAIGVDAEVVPITQTVPAKTTTVRQKGTITAYSQLDDGSITTTPVPIEGEVTSTEEAHEQTYYVLQGKGFKPSGSSSGSSSRPRGGGGGRGGGGSRAPRADKKKGSDKERYHTVTNQLEDLTDAYDKVSKAADRAFGKSRIKLLREQQDALKDLAATQQDYINEINDYYKQDLSNLDQVSQYVGFDVQLDENGTITNFDAIQDAMWEEYNSHINDDGEVTDMDEDAWKEYEEEWERIMALIEQYEETQDLRKEALQQLQDYINEIYDLQLEEVTYAVEVDIEASDDALKILDYLLGRIEDDAWKAAEAIAYMGDQAATMLDQNNTYTSGIRDILMNHTEDIRDSEGRLLQSAQLTQADVEGFMSGDSEALSKLMGLNDAFTEEEIQSLRDYHNSLIEMNETLIELRESVFDKVLESFEQFNEEMDKSIDKIDHLSAVTDNYKNIIDIVGKKNLNVSNALLDSLNQASTEQRINRVEATKTKRDTIAAEIATAEAALMNARANGLEEDAKLWEKTLEEMRVSLDEAEEDFMQSWEDALDGIREQFEEAVSHAVETLSDALAGPLMGSMDELQEAFDRQNTIAERYLPDYEKIYELNKLNRDITNSIDETDNIKAKQELAALQAEINALEESEAQISEYQMENLRRRYELKLAEIALTEAQDAKSQVQMSRDADGNWSYVYTANEDQVAEAEQNYEDKLFAMQEANAEYINAMQDNIVQLQAEMTQKIEEIMMDETLSAEEKMARVQEVTTFYQEQMQYYMDELELVLGENQTLYDEDWTKYNELTGYKISANEDYVDNFNETALSTLTGFQTMQEFQQNFNNAIGHPDTHGLLYDLAQAYETWVNNTEAAMNAAGTSVEDFANDMAEDVDDILDASEEATDAIEDMGEKVEEIFDQLTDAVENWSETYSAKIDEILQKNTALAESFNKLLQAWSDYNESTTDDSTDTPSEEEEPTGDDEPADEGADVQDTVAEKTEKYKKGIAFAIWSHPSSGWGHGNSSKNLTSGDRYDRLKAKGLDPNTVQQQINAYRGKSTDYMKKDSGISFKKWGDRVAALNPYTYKKFAFDTGGYTGEWGDEGRWAMLHEKEIVLNKDDTANLLTAIDIIRQISKTIDLNAYSSAGYGNSLIKAGMGSAGTLEQHVQITAEFPNATNREEIYSAFTDIINLASQYANKK